MKNMTFPLIFAVICLALSTLSSGCAANNRDGSDTQAACVAYVEAANACWSTASGEDVLDVATCDAVDADIDTAEIPGASSCGLKDLAEVYTCYADAFAKEITTDQPSCSDVGCASPTGCSTASACASPAACSDASFETEETCEAEKHDWDTLTTSEACQAAGLTWNDTSTQQACEDAGHQWGDLSTEEACEAAGEKWGTLKTRTACEAVGNTWATTCGDNADLEACEACCAGEGWDAGLLNNDAEAEACACTSYGLCNATETAGTVDVSGCDYSCARCLVGTTRCDGQKAQFCDGGTGNYKTLLTCPDNTTCNKGQCIADEPTCTPYCVDRACGDDGCGGSCGECAEGDTCTVGTCCTPVCDQLSCGDDQCGGTCGCAEGDVCTDGTCCTVADDNACECSVNSDCTAQDDGDQCNGVWGCIDGACAEIPDSAVVCSDPTTCATFACEPTTGECVKSYISCSEEYVPVCGDDGLSYANECQAVCDGQTTVASDGLCNTGGTLTCSELITTCSAACFGDAFADWECLSSCGEQGTEAALELLMTAGICAVAAGCLEPMPEDNDAFIACATAACPGEVAACQADAP